MEILPTKRKYEYSLLAYAEHLHMVSNGSRGSSAEDTGDGGAYDDMVYRTVKERLDNWQPSTCVYDKYVRAVASVALGEYEQAMNCLKENP